MNTKRTKDETCEEEEGEKYVKQCEECKSVYEEGQKKWQEENVVVIDDGLGDCL